MHGLIGLLISLLIFGLVLWVILMIMDWLFATLGFWNPRLRAIVGVIFFLIFLLWALEHFGIWSF